MMTFTQAVNRVCARLNKSTSDTTVTTRIKNHINDICLEKWHGYAWSFRWREYPLVLSARVTSGTLTATNGSQTVTASGTPFDTSLHVGAWLHFTGDSVNPWYRVLAVNSTSSVTIEPAYQGTTGSSKAYELAKTDYLLPTEISDIGQLKIAYNQRPLHIHHQLQTDFYNQPPLGIGVPCQATVFNHSLAYSTYTTGTLSGSVDTNTLTGVGTAWLSNVLPGDAVTINGDTNVYTVYRVESDTSLKLYQKLKIAASGATYTVSRQYGHVVRIDSQVDQVYVCFVKALRAYSPLINDADTNELLSRYPHAVIEGAVWREASSSPDPREDSLYQKSEMMWAKAQGEDEAILPYNNPYPIWNPRG